MYNFHLESIPLEIKTNSEDRVDIWMYDAMVCNRPITNSSWKPVLGRDIQILEGALPYMSIIEKFFTVFISLIGTIPVVYKHTQSNIHRKHLKSYERAYKYTTKYTYIAW